MADLDKCQARLLDIAKEHGYLTFDNILNESELFGLSLVELDFLSEALSLRGVIIYDKAPRREEIKDETSDEIDASKVDYEAIYSEILSISPQMVSFIERVKNTPFAQRGEIRHLFQQARDGNRYARERLILLHLRTVLRIALSMSKQFEIDIEDAVESGCVGLINAVDQYDITGFSTFGSYAALKIQQEIQRYCNPTWLTYYFPSNLKDTMLRLLDRFERLFTQDDIGGKIYNNVINDWAKEFDKPKEAVDRLVQYALSQKYGRVSIDEVVGLERIGRILPDTLVDDRMSAVEILIDKEKENIVKRMLSQLSNREAEVIRMRYGFNQQSVMTLGEIGNLMGISRERVRQIEAKAMRKLCGPSSKRLLKDYIP